MRTGEVSRRRALKFLASAALATIATNLPTSENSKVLSEDVKLPDGARQFSAIVSAQRQWRTLLTAFADDRTLEDSEWTNIRTYLRAVYKVSGDMDFLSKKWKGARRDNAKNVIRSFRTSVKDLDKPAADKDNHRFIEGHAKVSQLFDDFFEQLKSDTVGSVPSEL